MTKKETRDILNWFQANIGLSDWGIEVSAPEPPKGMMCDMPPEKWGLFLGRTDINISLNKARVWINTKAHTDTSEEAWQENWSEPETLVHELLHIFFADKGLDETSEQCEHAINQLAAALVKGMMKGMANG